MRLRGLWATATVTCDRIICPVTQVALMGDAFSKDGSLMAYALSSGGSDWRRVVIQVLLIDLGPTGPMSACFADSCFAPLFRCFKPSNEPTVRLKLLKSCNK